MSLFPSLSDLGDLLPADGKLLQTAPHGFKIVERERENERKPARDDPYAWDFSEACRQEEEAIHVW